MSQPAKQPDAILSKLDQSAATGIRASLGGVLVSVLLGAVKIVAGILGNSYALLADGVESMLDVLQRLGRGGQSQNLRFSLPTSGIRMAMARSSLWRHS